jgi:serine/threonine-protein kinase PpkA
VLIRQDGSPALIDFGISKRILVARYQDGQVFSMGSPYFMSPEQARGEPLDERSDIYSFGALWFRIFTGRTPFEGRTFQELCEARDSEAPSMGEALRHYQPIVDRTPAAD